MTTASVLACGRCGHTIPIVDVVWTVYGVAVHIGCTRPGEARPAA